MNNSKWFYDNKIFAISNYIWAFFLGNLYFILTSSLFLITMIAYGANILGEGFLYMYVTSLILGPAFCAITGVMYTLIKEKEVDITKEYFKSYISNFKEALLFWISIDSFIFFILFDIKMYSIIGNTKIVTIIFYLLILFAINISIYGFSIIVRFNMKTIDTIKLSILMIKNNFKTTVINTLVLFAGLVIVNKFLFLWGFCLFTLIGYFVVSNVKTLVDKLEEKSITAERIV